MIFDILKNATQSLDNHIKKRKNKPAESGKIQSPARQRENDKINADVAVVEPDAHKENKDGGAEPENNILQRDRNPAEMNNPSQKPEDIVVDAHHDSRRKRLQHGV